MSEHKLNSGINFIRGLEVLGKVLGYITEFEFPVIKNERTGPAIDVAWLMEKGQKFPLFIFEVESTASNSMAYNPLKVLGKPNEIFEKPLFYFQIVLNQGQNSTRIEDLKRAYGVYNYRIYRLSMAEETQLIEDILSQHRRVSGNLDIIGLIDFIESASWVKINVGEIITHIRKLEFEIKSGNFMQALGSLCLTHEHLVSNFISELNVLNGASIDPEFIMNYQTYIGSHFQVSIHLAIRALNESMILEKAYCFEKYKIWQKNGDFMIMVGPYFGLSQDYDQFLIFHAGGYFALLTALFSDVPGSNEYLCSELEEIIDATHPNYRIFNYLWLMIMAANCPNGSVIIKRACDFINSKGYYSKKIAYTLPFIADGELLHEFENSFDNFSLADFLEKPHHKIDNNKLTQTAIAALVENKFLEDISFNLRSYLLNR